MFVSTLSYHLYRLIRVGLVQQERQGTTLICRADYGVMAATFEIFAQECCVDDTSCCAPSVSLLVQTRTNDAAQCAEKADQ